MEMSSSLAKAQGKGSLGFYHTLKMSPVQPISVEDCIAGLADARTAGAVVQSSVR